MKSTIRFIALLCGAWLSLSPLTQQTHAQSASGGNYTLEKSVVAAGGGASSGGTYSLTGAVGQPIVGTSSSGTIVLEGGFFAGDADAGNTTPEPTTPPGNVAFSNVTADSFTVSFTPGNGAARLVVVRQSAAANVVPVDSTVYTANPAFGAGGDLGGGNFAVAYGNVTSVSVTNLSQATSYTVSIYEADGRDSSTNYLTSAFASGSTTTTTTAPPTAYSVKGAVTANGAPVAGVTVTRDNGAQTTTDANGNYAFAGIAAGSNITINLSGAGLMFAPSPFTITNINANTTADFTGTSGVVISEFRTRGASVAAGENGSANEFVELYNFTNSTIDLGGATLRTSDGVTLTLPANSLIAPRGNFLIGGADFFDVAADATLPQGTDIADGAGIAVFTDSASTNLASRLDAVGFANSPALYRERTGLAPASGVTQDVAHSFVRRFDALTQNVRDTNTNSADFAFVSTDAAIYDATQSTLGAAGANGAGDLTIRTIAEVSSTLLDTNAAPSAAPNRVRDTTPIANGTNGTLELRKTYTNNTGEALTTLRFRIIDITTAPAAGTAMDLRASSSGDTIVTKSDFSTVTVNGTTIETPPSGALGGGLNSSFVVTSVTPETPLAPGASINIRFRFGVNNAGRSYRFATVTETGTPPAPPPSARNHHPAALRRPRHDAPPETASVQPGSYSPPRPGIVAAR